MEELIIVKRDTRHNYKAMAIEPLLRVGFTKGRFHLSTEAAKIIGVKLNDIVLFAFNQRCDRAYIYKADVLNGFILRQKEKEYRFNFTSKILGEVMRKCYKINSKYALFEIGNLVVDNDKILFPLILRTA